MHRRSLLACTAALASASAFSTGGVAGCTFLIGFDEAAPVAEGGASTDGPILEIPEGGPGVRDADGAVDVLVDGGSDARDAIANPDACNAKADGKYCGGNQITWPVELKDDLVTCKTGQVSVVKYCATGQGCVAMINGYADECDECAKKADGTYCGRDFEGWNVTNANQRIRCQGGRVVGLLLCAGVCMSNGAASLCQ